MAIDTKTEWILKTHQSGSTLITNGDIAIYFHSMSQIFGQDSGLTDDELDAKKFEYARYVRDVLNRDRERNNNNANANHQDSP